MHHPLGCVNNFFFVPAKFFSPCLERPKNVLFSRGKWKISIRPSSVNAFL